MNTDLDLTPAGGFGHVHTQRMHDWFRLTPAKGPACLMRAAGKHHRQFPCPGCDDVGRLTMLDHGSTWRAPDGRRVVVGEPYDELDGADLVSLRERASALGLVIERLPISPWCPGSTHAWAAYLPGPVLVPAPEHGAVLRLMEREIREVPGLPSRTAWPEKTVSIYIPEGIRPPTCGGCDGPALPGGVDFTHDPVCELAGFDWARHESDLS